MSDLSLLCIHSRILDRNMNNGEANAALDQLKLLIIRRVCIASTRLEMLTDLKKFVAAFEEVDKKKEKEYEDPTVAIHPVTKVVLKRAGDDKELMEKIKSAKVICLQFLEDRSDDIGYIVTKGYKVEHWCSVAGLNELGFKRLLTSGLGEYGFGSDGLDADPRWYYGVATKEYPPAKEDVQSAMKGL